jgi:hypothetical protein
MLWITVTLLLGVLMLIPVGGVALHLYLYRHHPAPVPRPQPLSEVAQMMRLHNALFSGESSHE